MPRYPTSIILDDKMMDRLNNISNHLSEKASGITPKRSQVIRLALQKGFTVLEKELGVMVDDEK